MSVSEIITNGGRCRHWGAAEKLRIVEETLDGRESISVVLRDLEITRPNQVWCADITYIPMRRGFLYLVAVMGWATRKVMAWRLSNTMERSSAWPL